MSQNKEEIIDPETGKTGVGIAIKGLKVYTENGKFLGKVSSILVDKTFDVLKSIEVQKNYLFIKTNKIILWENIVEIHPKKIIVKDDLAIIKKTALSFLDSTA